MKKDIGSMAFAAGLLLMSGVPAMAKEYCGNKITGPFSYNRCKIDNEKKIYIDLDQRAKVKNYVHTDFNTGNNSEYTTKAKGGHTSGDVDADVKIYNDVNSANLLIAQGGDGNGQKGSNYVTGPFSLNTVEIKDKAKIDVDLNQNAYVKNDVTVNANTGSQCKFTTICNTGSSGDIDSDVKIVNKVNDAVLTVVQN